MSKGSGRRPASVSDAELAARWAETFKPKYDGPPTLGEEMERLGLGEVTVHFPPFYPAFVIKSDTPDSEK